jgi:NodT family efflux transporter outer membrane factor (OMF) lipoprotein
MSANIFCGRINSQEWKRLLSLFPVLFLFMMLPAGCITVGPDYRPPDLTVPEQWGAELTGESSAKSLDMETLANWWSTLNDPELTNIIKRAAEGNPDLRKAKARVREARARRDISRAGLFPTLKTTGSASRSAGSKETGSGRERELYDLGFDATWELDIFGGVRRSIEASEAGFEAGEEDLRDVLVSLLAEVALNYIDIRSYQNRLSIARSNLSSQEETYRITQWRFQAGLTSQLDVEQALSNLEQTRSQIPSLETGLEQALNRLAVLLGENPGSVHEELMEEAPIPVATIEIAIGLPADALRRIPGVRSAERRLAEQTAQVGVAVAGRYSVFTLVGSIGLEALSLNNLFSSASRTWRFGPNFSWTLFDAGRIRKNVEVQNALQEQALAEYEGAVLTALEDVENALVAYAKEQIRRQSLEDAAQAAQRAVGLARDQYTSGTIDFQVVLTAQRSLLSLQDQLAVSSANITSDLIRLYKALGGVWQSMASNIKE